MNEEELKEERDLRATLDMWENMEEEQRLKQLKFLINEGFQKGKLEQKKEELKVIKNIRWICARLQLKDISFELEDIYRECTDRIKQLQKEIGGMK